jgi:hypothetical protein
MAKDREHLSFDDDQIDLEDLVTTPQSPPTTEQYERMRAAGERFGFIDRSPKVKKIKKPTPYIVQYNAKLRVGMKELLNDLNVN